MSAQAIISEGSCVWKINMFIVFSKAETRAEFAERTVAKLEKTIDDLEGTPHFNLSFQYSDLHCFFTVLCSSLYHS